MPLERAVEIYAIVNFVVIGLSHALRPRPWVAFFTLLRQHGEAGVFAIAFLALMFGSIIVAFHNVWSGIPLLLTLFGWAQVTKALVYFVFPGFVLRKLRFPGEDRASLFVPPGVAFLLLAGLLGYHLWTT